MDVVFDLNEIKKILPHREPFLLIDEIILFEPEKQAVGIKVIKENEYYLKGHFPDRPIVPGVILTEIIAQVGGIIINQMDFSNNKLAVLVGLNKMRFRGMVKPNDKLVITAEVISTRETLGKLKGRIEVNNKIVAEGEMLFSLVD